MGAPTLAGLVWLSIQQEAEVSTRDLIQQEAEVSTRDSIQQEAEVSTREWKLPKMDSIIAGTTRMARQALTGLAFEYTVEIESRLMYWYGPLATAFRDFPESINFRALIEWRGSQIWQPELYEIVELTGVHPMRDGAQAVLYLDALHRLDAGEAKPSDWALVQEHKETTLKARGGYYADCLQWAWGW